MAEKLPYYVSNTWLDGQAVNGEHFGKLLLGPDEFECLLGEPEDCGWLRDGRDAVARLNEQDAEIKRLKNELLEAANPGG
jgi:hypothetical protein